ncbi:MAG: hypothetical protein ACRCRU_10660 [Vibrio sp.]|uniref:hypothetical protein n=1 Tax=Vibrio sp. TaxID=678 RepID=UPI003F2D2E1B
MKKTFVTFAILVISATIIGCGGSDSDAETQTIYAKDGIYLNDTDLVVMLIDTDLADSAMLIGDYVNNDIYFNGTHTISRNMMNTRGLAYVSSDVFYYDDNLKTSISFVSGGATVSTVINNKNLIYSFDRIDDSKPVTDLFGLHSNPVDNSSWEIKNDNTFTINGICTISGTLKRVKGYFSAEGVKANHCDEPSLEADNYSARFITVEQDGKTYILGAMANDNAILWGSTPI